MEDARPFPQISPRVNQAPGHVSNTKKKVTTSPKPKMLGFVPPKLITVRQTINLPALRSDPSRSKTQAKQNLNLVM